MALKRLRTKKSKRLTGKLKHKIEKKVREHNRKIKRDAKKSPKKCSKKQKLIQIPNICPFKEDILKEVEEAKKRKEEDRLKRREAFKTEKDNKFKTLDSLINSADIRGTFHSILHENNSDHNEKQYKEVRSEEQSLKQYFKEFKKVMENADVILEVVDARDPLGTRCLEVERAVRSSPGNKRLVLILNKSDLVPRENLKAWLNYFRRFGPVTAFKASTQTQKSKLGRRKFKQMNSEKAIQGSMCIGAELLMSMLGNYCRNKGIKTSIRVGVVGIPNVGKSSIINSLTRGKSCSVGCTPGVTRVMQEIELDSKIKLIDCPGIVFASSTNNDKIPAVLKNAQRVGDVKDPFTVAESVLNRASKEYFCKLYDITEYDTFEEFFAKKAARMGKFLKKGVPDVVGAARSVLNDWNTGKIKYCTHPPVVEKNDVHLSASIVHAEAREFDVDNFETMEKDILSNFDVKKDEVMEITSTGPVERQEIYEIENKQNTIINESEIHNKSNKRKLDDDDSNIKKPKTDPSMELEGNQTLNKNIRENLRKKKKQIARNEKKVAKIADVLENFCLSTSKDDDKYDFDEDYAI